MTWAFKQKPWHCSLSCYFLYSCIFCHCICCISYIYSSNCCLFFDCFNTVAITGAVKCSLSVFYSGARGRNSAGGCSWGISWWLLCRGSHVTLSSWRTWRRGAAQRRRSTPYRVWWSWSTEPYVNMDHYQLAQLQPASHFSCAPQYHPNGCTCF